MTTKIRYIYIDDQSAAATAPYAEGLQRKVPDLAVDHRFPVQFSEQLRRLKNEDHQGLILDLRLDESENPDGERTEYRATALAQEIRTRTTEGRMRDVPIVLLSTDTKFKNSFDRDDTSHDLFDAVFNKEAVLDNAESIAKQLVSLARAYEAIGHGRAWNREYVLGLLGLQKSQFSMVDPRLGARFDGIPQKLPAHEYARFILKKVVVPASILIREDLLAARLGIDIVSSPDWAILRGRVDEAAAYRGLFSDGWPRWWMPQVTNWWEEIFGNNNLRSLTAEERVSLISKKLKLKRLNPAAPIDAAYRTSFWTLCEGFHRPLDPIDGLVVDGPEPEPWQEKRYISIRAALERVGHRDGLRVHLLERDRLEELKGRAK